MVPNSFRTTLRSWKTWGFFMLQTVIFLLAIQNESLWIDEFVTAYFASLDSFDRVYELLFITKGSQTPLHYLYYYAWGLLVQSTEFNLRLANLPFFLFGQGALYFALRPHPTRLRQLFLIVSAIHPMVWQYANEARPYIMMYGGSEMILAYLLHLHALPADSDRVNPRFTAVFVVGSILLFGGSMLGGFWVFAATVYAAYFHYRHLKWHYLKRGLSLTLVCIFLLISTLLSLYYLDSVIHGGGASRVSTTTWVTLLFDAYELLGLSGVGPGRLELRESGLASLEGYRLGLLLVATIFLIILYRGIWFAIHSISRGELIYIVIAILLPAMIIVASGFIMHWRVLGRHLITLIPFINLLFAAGMTEMLEGTLGRGRFIKKVSVICLLVMLVYSSCLLRFADRHKKDDYRTAAAIALYDLSRGKRVWWVAYGFGALHYEVPVEYNRDSEFNPDGSLLPCTDKPKVNLIYNPSRECLKSISQPATVILSKLETFDKFGSVTEYLKSNNFVMVRTLPAFTIWSSSEE